MTQILPIIIVVAVIAVSLLMRSRVRGRTHALYSGALDALKHELAARRAPGEHEPLIVIATERKLLSATIFYVGVTDRRVVIHQPGSATRSFDRTSCQLAIRAKTFTDTGNMQTTVSRGWELRVVLADGTRGAWRVYDHADGIPDHAAHVKALVAMLPGELAAA